MSVTDRNKRIILTLSGNRCAFPKCEHILVFQDEETRSHALIAQIAHIKGERSGSARYDESMNDEQRNHPDNLIVMCANHHKIIDDQPETYSAEILQDMKKNHQEWVIQQTKKSVSTITFAELNVVTKFLLNNSEFQYDMDLINPTEKVIKNSLSSSTEALIKIGLSRANLVEKYIEDSPDPKFGERLRQGFVEEYQKLSNEGIKGDNLFEILLSFASGGSPDFKQKAAGLTVLSYFFERCDIFEK